MTRQEAWDQLSQRKTESRLFYDRFHGQAQALGTETLQAVQSSTVKMAAVGVALTIVLTLIAGNILKFLGVLIFAAGLYLVYCYVRSRTKLEKKVEEAQRRLEARLRETEQF